MSEVPDVTWTVRITTGWRREMMEALEHHPSYGERWRTAVLNGEHFHDDDPDSDWVFSVYVEDTAELVELLHAVRSKLPRRSQYQFDLYASIDDRNVGVRSEAMLHDPSGMWAAHPTFARVTCTDRDDARRQAMGKAIRILEDAR